LVAVEISKLALTKNILSRGRTGIVIAGFGAEELFPTLISFEIDGGICDHVKYVETNHVDIDRKGPRAKVLPFAQKEMVERFLYGLDSSSRAKIVDFAASTVSSIRAEVLKMIDLPTLEATAKFVASVKSAEDAFLDGLKAGALAPMQERSEAEIADMVEFMPKPELAKMAEALVNLTSIKRRVSRGMETVGGPIDVAIISQSEGFVWIKRKHYFPPELNVRYNERVKAATKSHQEDEHDRRPSKPGRSGKARRGKSKADGRESNGAIGDAFGGGRDKVSDS
jgi:hypothetical protein